MASVAPPASTGTTGQVARVTAALAAGVLGPDHDPAVPERMLATLELLPSRQDHDRLVDALRLLGSRVGALLLTGSPAPVPDRSREAVELLLQRWWRSRMRTRRQLAGALTSAALAAEYSFPGAALARTGYPGPLGPAPDEPRRLEPLEIDADQELSCDVVVVGSGAGGGVVAAQLAAAGADVIVLEKGGYAAEADFHHQEAESTRDLYLYGLTMATSDPGCGSSPAPPSAAARWSTTRPRSRRRRTCWLTGRRCPAATCSSRARSRRRWRRSRSGSA
jgi:hypothetical protein